MAKNYLDKEGVSYLWQKIKNKFVAKEAGKGLSTNDYDATAKNKVDKIVINGDGNSFLANDGSYKAIDFSSLEDRIEGLENLGQYVGTFNTKADILTNVSSFDHITLNDFINIRADESKSNVPTRYIAKQINRDTGVITWQYDISYSTDISGKMDKVANGTLNKLLLDDGTGNAKNSTFSSDDLVVRHNNQSISGKKTFDVLPESSVVPTTNNQLVNKKFVDDQMKTIIPITNAEIDTICDDETV